MAEFEFSGPDATLIAACIAAATSIVVARQLQVGGEPEKQIAERAYRIYEATVSRFELPARREARRRETLELVARTGSVMKTG